MKLNLHQYQKKAVKFLVERGEGALFLDPGLGKTAITLKALQIARAARSARKALVIAPLRVCSEVWSQKGELGKWNDFEGLRAVLLHGSRKDEALDEDADIYVVNYDGLQWLTSPRRGNKVPRLYELYKRGVDTLIYDELSKMKHIKTLRMKSLKPHLHLFKRRWGLTGSPAANGLEDLFGECYAIDLGKALGPFITHFRMKYFVPTGNPQWHQWRPAEGADKRIYAAIKGLALSMRATDHLDLPDLVEENLWVALPPDARKFYDDLESELAAMLADELITAGSAGTAAMKCRQVAGGGLYVHVPKKLRPGERLVTRDTGEVVETRRVHDAKLEALRDLVDELQGAPLLVGFEFRHERDRMREALGNVPSIDGEASLADTSRIASQWNAGLLPVLLAHPQAAGHGLNLQGSGCAHVCWYTVPWDFELYSQFIDRVRRQGNQASRVVVHRILARDTVDVVVAKALASKERTQSAVFSALKDYTKGRKAA